ncbi:MAG TPA: RsmE family RNA methyltransferase [Thermoanaerobaculia bacterium]|nr:RsmE family RNA methyltransferase [Thermoanaerobaculia bacterium]
MKHRFFVPDRVEVGATIALHSEERHHARVLRVREGEEVEIFDSQGRNFVARLDDPDSIAILRESESRELRTEIRLAMSIIQLEKFELVLQKATELGVASFIPLITDRMEVRIERLRGREDRWKKIVLEAVKQSGRSKIPVIETPTEFDDAIKREGTKIIFDADTPPATEQPSNPATLFIGPEGGFSERELQLARASGAALEQLGPRRLRAETAAIVAVALVAARSGDI